MCLTCCCCCSYRLLRGFIVMPDSYECGRVLESKSRTIDWILYSKQ